MTDDEIRQAMTVIARAAGLQMSPQRIEHALPVYKSYLQAIDAIRRVDLPLETEPASFSRDRNV